MLTLQRNIPTAFSVTTEETTDWKDFPTAVCSSETSATQLTPTRCQYQKAVQSLAMNRLEAGMHLKPFTKTRHITAW
jgi:hypothetical protein